MKKMYAYVNGICPACGVKVIQMRPMTIPNWSLYLDNVKYRRDNPDWNQTIKSNVNQRHNALKTQ